MAVVNQSSAAVNAQDKAIELAREAHAQLLDQLDGQLLLLPLADPLSLQLAVLKVTDSLTREMSVPTWQAMLRALGAEREILRRFADLRPRFTAMEKQLVQGRVEERLTNLSRHALVWSRSWPPLHSIIETIGGLHGWFDRYQRNAAVVNERTLRDYAESVHGSEGLTTINALEQLHQHTCPDDEADHGLPRQHTICYGGAFDILANYLSKASNGVLCSQSKSPHQIVYDLYTLLALTDAKGYAMMQFSWMLLRLYNKGNFTLESELARAAFEERLTEKTIAARRVLATLPTWTWTCDASHAEQRENETYIQFTEVLQGYVVNEVDLNSYKTCKESCPSYGDSREVSCYANQTLCEKSRRCPNGRIYNCGFVEADATVCLSDLSSRRYNWIEYKSGHILGQKTECNSGGRSRAIRVDSWWRWLIHCSYCVCLCDQPSRQSDRYVSLRPALASDAANHLVTGVRFVKSGRMVHVQVQEGEALARGAVNVSTQRWLPVEPVVIPERNIGSTKDGDDYATLRYEERALDLDDLVAPIGHVVTGLRFRKIGGHLNLEVRVAPIDFASGTIYASRATWIANDKTSAAEVRPRTKIQLTSPDLPTKSPIASVPDSNTETYVEFQASSLERDVSQTTVPFLDAQIVAPQPPVWITGVGLYHKGQPGYGGFVAFRLQTLNVTDYMVVPQLQELKRASTVSLP